MSHPLTLSARRPHITQKVPIVDQRTPSMIVHDDEHTAEIFLRIKGPDCSQEVTGLYDVIARLLSRSSAIGASLEQLGDLLTGAKFAPCRPVSGHDRLEHCSSLPDLIGRHLLIECCGRGELAHVSVTE